MQHLNLLFKKMKKVFTVLLLFCAISCFAQEPLLKTQWNQGHPYNMLCPADPMENYAHCYTGCPATAMGQVINYLRTTQNTRFDDGDDYTASYAGRVFHIDDDWEAYQFPSFPQLNMLLDEADAAFENGEQLSDQLIAAVIFACGVACTEVFTASSSYGSGTFYVDQAYAAYQRFGFTDCQLFREPSDEMYETLISNLQAGYPAHLAIENEAANSGHNVVVDGYRESDGKFHVNFGWGGYKDNWYAIPDPAGFGYGWTKIEGIILDIIPNNLTVNELANKEGLGIYPNPVSDILYIDNFPGEHAEYAIFNVMGQMITTGSTIGSISVADLEKGFYVLQIKGEKNLETARFIKD